MAKPDIIALVKVSENVSHWSYVSLLENLLLLLMAKPYILKKKTWKKHTLQMQEHGSECKQTWVKGKTLHWDNDHEQFIHYKIWKWEGLGISNWADSAQDRLIHH